MNQADVREIGNQLGINVPKDYVDLVTNYPSDLHEYASEWMIYDSAERVIKENRELRNGPVFGVTWPDSYFMVGRNEACDYFALDLNLANPLIIMFDHETGEFCDTEMSIAVWGQKLLHEYDDD